MREFKRGAFKIAYDNNVPIVPMMITYRKSKGWRKITNKKPLLNISILTPVFPDYGIEERAAIEKMMNDCYEQMEMKNKECELNRETERVS